MHINQNSYEVVPPASKEIKRIAEYNKAKQPELLIIVIAYIV